jgi:hypothetical protein
MGRINMHDPQHISSDAVGAQPGMTAAKAGARTVGPRIFLKKANIERLKATLAEIDALAAQRDPAEDDKFLIAEGIDPTNWSMEAVRALRDEKA